VVELTEGWWWKILLGWLVLIVSVTAILARVQEAQKQKQSRQPLRNELLVQEALKPTKAFELTGTKMKYPVLESIRATRSQSPTSSLSSTPTETRTISPTVSIVKTPNVAQLEVICKLGRQMSAWNERLVELQEAPYYFALQEAFWGAQIIEQELADRCFGEAPSQWNLMEFVTLLTTLTQKWSAPVLIVQHEAWLVIAQQLSEYDWN
jgi:hypothetical protein